VQAYYNGRAIGRADITVADDSTVSTTWTKLAVSTTDPKDAAIDAIVTAYATDPLYLSLINQPVGYSQVDLQRNYNGDNMMGSFVDDTVYNSVNSDSEPQNDVDMFFSNPGGLRADICSGTCTSSGLLTAPMLLTYGQLFTVLPFGNQVVVGDMTGAQILELLHQSATLFKGAIQPSGIRYSFYRYTDVLPGEQPYGWGAFAVSVYSRTASTWEPLELTKTYRVGTNEFLAPAGQDGFIPFKYMTNITYWGDMLNVLVAGVATNHSTSGTAYKGPNANGTLDSRITRNGTDAGGTIIPLTILHHNDSYGNLLKVTCVGYTQLATLIQQERAHNPSRTLLLSAGDNIQGDAMMYYAPLGYASDGTPIADPSLHIQPLIKVFNAMNCDAMTLGNHEFNFGNEVFKNVLSQATFPLLQANVRDSGAYGLATANILPSITKTLGAENIKVAILGIGNHRVPFYELPSNISGLTFSDPLAKAQELSTALRSGNDVVIALSHIGFTENPNSIEVDENVDTKMAATVTGIHAIVGGHSHTNPATGFGAYKYLPAIVADPDGMPVIINQAYRYNNTLGEVVLGLKSKPGGGYAVVSQTGRYLSVSLSGTDEDAATKAIIDPYQSLLSSYNASVIGQTTEPLDTLTAFTQETNGANLQADASVAKLAQEGISVDLHLAGAATNRQIAGTATPATPYSLTIADLFTFIPYDNSLVVLNMNGPQIKAVLERAYRNYYYYKYVPGYGGYSYYTVGMLVPDAGSQIVYYDGNPDFPNGNNVVSLQIQAGAVNFNDPETYYRVSTLNYLAAGICNFNDSGTSLWPLDQITDDTQYYVRDAVIEYIQD
jgi:2',3'-cyclic-nucleotide 2'-phosphodiesterase (5'-nucleotidase family)